MKTYKTIRVSQDTYEELLEYRASLEKINRCRISFNDALDMLFGEVAGAQYEIACERGRFKEVKKVCSCGAAAKLAPPGGYGE